LTWYDPILLLLAWVAGFVIFGVLVGWGRRKR